MHRQIRVIALFAATALVACSTDTVIAPAKAVRSASRAITAANLDQRLVLLKGNAIPKDFAARVQLLGGKVTFSHAAAGFAVVSGLTDAAATQLGKASDVADVQLDAAVGLDAPTAHVQLAGHPLNVPSIASVNNPQNALGFALGWQWNLNLIHADAAWTATPKKLGSSAVTVAILDTGIDYDGLDLAGHVDLGRSTSFMSSWVGPAGTPPGLSDNQMVAAKFPGRNAISDLNGHGTNVASQVSSNAFFFAGVTSKTTLIGVKVLGANGYGSFGSILAGVLWAADHGADVANMSLGGSDSKAGNGRAVSAINRVFNYARQKGMTIVVSAGNSSEDLQHNGNTLSSYCDAPHVICVASVGPVTSLINPDQPAFYTNFGRNSISVAAPGGSADISSGDGSAANPFPVSPRPWGDDFASWIFNTCSKTLIAHKKDGTEIHPCEDGFSIDGYIGTSQASPHVAGLAALLIADKGKGQPQTIKHLIEQSGDPINPAYGRSRINVKSALGL